jgi:hypothetical protein
MGGSVKLTLQQKIELVKRWKDKCTGGIVEMTKDEYDWFFSSEGRSALDFGILVKEREIFEELKKPSERIRMLADQYDPKAGDFKGHRLISAVVDYLDEEWEKAQREKA